LDDFCVKKVEEANSERRQLFLVKRRESGNELSSALQELDLILSINGKIITRIHDLDVNNYWPEEVTVVSESLLFFKALFYFISLFFFFANENYFFIYNFDKSIPFVYVDYTSSKENFKFKS